MYSQNEEEKYILEAAGDREQPGVFLDIGAFDGKTFSNTLALIERGWSGVLVEPSPYAFEFLLARHGNNSRLALVNAAVGRDRRLALFHPSRDAVSTTDVTHYRIWKDTAHYDPSYFLPQITVEDILTHFQKFLHDLDFVSIDTEGTSADLFLHFPFHLSSPRIFCVEYDSSVDAITGLLAKIGYKIIYKSNENVVLVRD